MPRAARNAPGLQIPAAPYHTGQIDSRRMPQLYGSPSMYYWRSAAEWFDATHAPTSESPIIPNPLYGPVPSPEWRRFERTMPAMSPYEPLIDTSTELPRTSYQSEDPSATRSQPPRDPNMRALALKPRYTAEEDLFIRFARAERVSWSIIAIVLKERYQHSDTRNKKNLQVHFCQKINPTVGSATDLTVEESRNIEKWLSTRLQEFYVGVAGEFRRITLSNLSDSYVQNYARLRISRMMHELHENLELARSLAVTSRRTAPKESRTQVVSDAISQQ